MKLKTIFSFLMDCLELLRGKIHRKKGTIKAYKSYEKKGRHDFEKTHGVHLRKEQCIPETKLLEFSNCHSVDDAIRALEGPMYPDGYVLRIAYIWEYYENIDVG